MHKRWVSDPLPLGEGLSLRERSDRQGERVRVVRLSRRQPFLGPCDGFADGQAGPSSVRFAATFSQWEKEEGCSRAPLAPPVRIAAGDDKNAQTSVNAGLADDEATSIG